MSKLLRASIICLYGLLVLATPAFAAEETKLSGAILKLSEITDKAFTVNAGGLVVVIVRDSGSRPPQEIKVEAPRAYEKLGVVRGAQDEKGQLLLGGGFTWHLFTPVAEGDTTIKVSYTENGEGGKRISREYKVKVEKGK